MNYLLPFIFLFILISYSNFLNLKFKVKLNETFFVSLCFIILVSYLVFKLELNYNIIGIEKTLFIFVFFSLITFIYLIKNFKKINFFLNAEFILIYIIIFFLSIDRYYLDQDEFTYWGPALKALFMNQDMYYHFFQEKFTHHPPGLSIFRYLFVASNFDEGISIFSNNIFLISGFFFLFYKRILTFFEKCILFIIYFLLFNNLSFGFISIYSDPILAVFYACLINKFFFIFNDKNFNKDFSIVIILFTILLINRSAVIYFLFSIYLFAGLYFIDNYKKMSRNLFFKFLLILALGSFFIYQYLLPISLSGNHELKNVIDNLTSNNFFFNQLTSLIISPIYFSSFGVTLNSIFDLIFSLNFRIYEFKIPLIIYILFLLPFFFFKFKFRWFLLISSIFIIVSYMIIVLVLKVGIEKLHISAIPRYIGIIILAKYIFIISVVIFSQKQFYKDFIFLFFLLFLLAVTPKKTLGFFATKDIYYKSLSNKTFKINRENISKLTEIKKNYDNFLLVHKENFSDLTNINISGEHSFYHNIIEYELFPKKPKYIKLKNYLLLENMDKEKNTLIILFDLPSSDVLKINSNSNFIEIKTY